MGGVGNVFFGQKCVKIEVDRTFHFRFADLSALFENGLIEQLDIEVVADGVEMTMLFCTEQVSRTANFHIAQGDFESRSEFGILPHGFKPFAGNVGERLHRRIGEIGVSAARRTSDTSADLVQLG